MRARDPDPQVPTASGPPSLYAQTASIRRDRSLLSQLTSMEHQCKQCCDSLTDGGCMERRQGNWHPADTALTHRTRANRLRRWRQLPLLNLSKSIAHFVTTHSHHSYFFVYIL